MDLVLVLRAVIAELIFLDVLRMQNPLVLRGLGCHVHKSHLVPLQVSVNHQRQVVVLVEDQPPFSIQMWHLLPALNHLPIRFKLELHTGTKLEQ